MSSFVTYNEPLVPQIATDALGPEGKTRTWQSLKPCFGSVRNEQIKSAPGQGATTEVAQSWVIGLRDDIMAGLNMGAYRFKWREKYLYPRTYFQPNGREFNAVFVEEEDH